MGERELIHLGPLSHNSHGDAYFPEVNGSTFRDRSAADVYEERFQSHPFTPHSLYIICGTDSGLLPKYILSLPAISGSHFLFIELPEVIEALRGHSRDVDTAEHIHIIPLEDFDRAVKELEIDHFFYRKALYLVPSFAILHSPHPSYADLAWRSQQVIDRISLNLGIRLNNRFFFLTMLRNLAENRTPVTELKGAFANRTAVVLGAGPSLDALIPWVQKHRSKLDVLAVSRTSRRLLEAGITPDFVFSIDPQAVSFDVGKHMLRFGEDTVFVNNTHACPQLLGQWPWRSLYWGTRLPWGTSTSESPGNTVTHLAVWTAVQLGYRRVILGGVDLCFTREGFTHAQGSAERDAGPNFLRGAVEVETNQGEIAETDHQFFQGITEMGQVAFAAHRQDTQIINSAATAARIPNIDFQLIEDLADPDNLKPAQALIKQTLGEENNQVRKAYYESTLEEVAKTRRDLRRIRKWSREALRQIRQAFKQDSPEAFRSRNRKIDAAENRIRKQYPGLRSTLIQLQAGEFIGVLRPKKQEWTPEEIEEVSRKVFDGYIRSAKDLDGHLLSVEARLKTRLMEEDDSSTAKLDELIAQWREDSQPGRYFLVERRNPKLAKHFNGEQRRDLTREYEEALSAVRAIPILFDPEIVRQRAYSLWERGDKNAMKRLLSGLEEHSSPEACALVHLLTGYEAEIATEADAAQQHYNRVDAAAFPRAREDALRRISAIALQERNAALAVAALRELTSISPIYRPQYANLLRITGKFAEAIDEYTTHMAENPQDTDTMLRLGDLYRELGAQDAAKIAYQYVLTMHPQKAVARERLESLE